MLIPIYVIEVRNLDHQPLTLGTEYGSLAITQRLLFGAPTVFVNVEDGLDACVDLQDEYGHRFTYHLVTAGEVEVNEDTVPSVFEEYRERTLRPTPFTFDFAQRAAEAREDLFDLNDALGR